MLGLLERVRSYLCRNQTSTNIASSTDPSKEVYDSITDALSKMKDYRISRLVLSLDEFPGNQTHGRWLRTDYYPFEELTEDEQIYVSEGKNYQVIALVSNNIHDGLEVVKRARTNTAYLPRFKTDHRLYATDGGVYTGDDLRELSKSLVKSGWTSEGVRQRVNQVMEEYYLVDESIERIAREYKDVDQILAEIRGQIESAKSSNRKI